MAIQLVFSSSVGRLGRALATGLARNRRGSDPFAKSLIIVPNPNLAKWLTFELAETHGIAANLEFRYLEDGLRLLLGGEQARVLDRDLMRQLIVSVLLAAEGGPELEPFHRYCASSVSGEFDPDDRECARRVWQLAGRLAAHFAEYEFHRGDMIEMWLTRDGAYLDETLARLGREATPTQQAMETAQRCLYRRICQPETGLAARLGEGWRPLPMAAGEAHLLPAAGTPQDVHLFGLSQLSQFHCLLLHRLAAAYDLYLYHFNVCTEFWEDMTTTAEDRWRAVRAAETREVPEEGEELDLTIENPLLKAWGKAGRETVKLLADLEESGYANCPIWLDEPEDPPGTVLRAVQQLVARRTSTLAERLPQDRSLQVAGCPGILREVETVHDSIVANMLDADAGHSAGLKLTDIAVLVPDMTTYKPVLGQVFDGRGQVPYNLVDSTAAEDSVYGRGLLGLLDLAAGDFSRRQVFELLLNPCFMAAAGVDRDEVSAWLDLADELGVFHDLDVAQRTKRGLDPSWRFTWEQALRRLRLGMVLDPAEAVTADSPFADFPAASKPFLGDDVAGRFSVVVRRLGTALRHLADRRQSCVGWRDTLEELMATFLEVPEDLPGEQQVRKALVRALESLVGAEGDGRPGLAACLAAAAAEESLGLSLLREYLTEALGAIPSGRGRYLVGGVTIASFLPMRPIPFKIVYIVGLQEGGFPGRADRSTLDLRLVRRRLGDVSRPDANRYLFLENLMAVRERLYLTYVNRDLAKDETFFPCSVLKQLLDFTATHVLPDTETFQQPSIPLRPADWACVRPRTRAWSDLPPLAPLGHRLVGLLEQTEHREALADALGQRLRETPTESTEAAAIHRALWAMKGEEPFVEEALAVPESATVSVTTGELERFLRDPAAATLRRHLSLREGETAEALLAEDEPVAMDHLERYALVRDALTEYAATGDMEEAQTVLRERLDAAESRSCAPSGVFGDLQRETLAETLHERIGEQDPFGPMSRAGLLRDVVFGGSARAERPPGRQYPEASYAGIPVDDRTVDVAVSGRLDFLWPAQDGVARALVVTDSVLKTSKLADGGKAPVHQVLGPLLGWCVLRQVAHDMPLGETLDVTVAHRKSTSNSALALTTWRFELPDVLATSWVRSLLTELLEGRSCDLLPYVLLVQHAELVDAVRSDDAESGRAIAGAIQDWIDGDAENLHPSYRPPEFLGAMDSLAVPEDAWERIVSRLGPVWRGDVRP